MPTVANETPFATTLPASGWESNPAMFMAETERNEGFDPLIAWPGFGQVATYEAPSVGVLSRIAFLLEGNSTTTRSTGTIATTDQFPHGLVQRLTLRINGQAAPWNCRGVDLNVLRQARYRTIVDSPFETFAVTTTGTGAVTPLRVLWEIPLALDPAVAPNLGGLFVQSANSQVVAEITTAAKSEVVTLTGDGTYDVTSANFRPLRTWFSIPTGRMRDGKVGMILPDLSVLHGLLSQEEPVTTTGEKIVNLNRLQGTIARLWFRITNGVAGQPSLDPATAFSQVRFSYASNQRPRVYTQWHMLEEQVRHYRGVLPFKALAIDQVSENLTRDGIDVENLSDPQLIVDILTGTTINAGARIHTVTELLSPLA